MSEKNKNVKFIFEEVIYLYQTVNINKIKSKEVRDFLKDLYSEEGIFVRVFASVMNAMISQKMITFILSKRLLDNLIQKDSNLERKALQSAQYKYFIHQLLKNKILIKLREPSGKKGGVYQLNNEEYLEFVDISYDKIKKQEDRILRRYDEYEKDKKDRLLKSKDKIINLKEKLGLK